MSERFPRWSRLHKAVLTAVLLLGASVAWYTRAPEVSVGGDEATYLILSHSIDHGHYRDEFLVGAPPHAQYPPGAPIWIWSIRHLVGPDLDMVRAANILLLAIAALLLGDAVRRLAGPIPGIAAAALAALNPSLLAIAGTALSEPPFLFLVTLAVWAALMADDHPTTGWVALAGAAALAGFLTRTVGVALVAGVGVWLVIRRRWSAAAVWSGVSLAVMGAWFGYTALAGANTAGHTYAMDLNQVGHAYGAARTGLAAQVANSAREYLIEGLPALLNIPSIAGTVIDNLLWLMVLGVAGTAGLVVLVRRWPAAAGYALVSTAVLLIWPWPVFRLLVPLVPVLAAALVLGAATLGARVGPRATALFPLGLTLLLGAPGLVSYVRDDPFHRCRQPDAYTIPGCVAPGARALITASHFVRDSLPAEAVVATAKPATVFLFSGHATVPFETLLTDERRTSRLDLPALNVSVILLSPVQARLQRQTARMLARHCEELQVRARTEPATFLLVSRGGAEGSDSACQNITAYEKALMP